MVLKGSGKRDLVYRDRRKWFFKRLLLKMKEFLKDTENEPVDARKW